MKVFRLNEMEWFAAENMEDAIREGLSLESCTREELVDGDAHELSKEEMERLIFHNEDGTKVTFAEHLAILEKDGEPFPRFFATTEY